MIFAAKYAVNKWYIRRMPRYIHQLRNWPQFTWNTEEVTPLLVKVRHLQGRLLGKMSSLGFSSQESASLEAMTLDVVKSSEIEGHVIDEGQVRSSIARRLGIEIAGLVPADRYVEGVVAMMLDATQNYTGLLTEDRLFGWQAALFPTGRSGMHKIAVGAWRNNTDDDPMQVVSGAMGREIVHFEAPASERLTAEMAVFIDWFNNNKTHDSVIKAAIAHLWFLTVHPFDDGNGRIARALTDMLLACADDSALRFYSMSAQIRKERKGYYDILEETQKGDLDITGWLGWFLNCLHTSLLDSGNIMRDVLQKATFWQHHATTTLNDRQKLMLNKILDGFDGKLTSSKWAKITKCSQDTALRDITDLVQKGVLEKEEGGGRSVSYKLSL